MVCAASALMLVWKWVVFQYSTLSGLRWVRGGTIGTRWSQITVLSGRISLREVRYGWGTRWTISSPGWTVS